MTSTPFSARPVGGPLVVLDADSTLIREEAIELLAEAAGCRGDVAAITERAMRGGIDFAPSLRERVAALGNLDVTAFAAVRARMTPTTGITQLVSGVHAAGGAVGDVSGGFHELLDPLAEHLQLHFFPPHTIALHSGKITP